MWTFKLPTAVTFGNGIARQLPQIARAHGSRPLLVADRDLVRLPLFDAVLKQFGELSCTLREAGIPASDIPLLVRESFHPLMRNNPRPVTESDLTVLYERLA